MKTFAGFQEEVAFEEEVITDQSLSLVVFNDDYNSFEHVIETLVDVCGHGMEQAEQCTWIIHFKGKCAVKSGSYDMMNPMKQAICERGIDARVL